MKFKALLIMILIACVAAMACAQQNGNGGDGGGDGGNQGSGDQGDGADGHDRGDGHDGKGNLRGRVFTYWASDFVNQDFSKAGTVTLKAVTNVNVNPFLYIYGNLSANWTVNGWGVGQDSQYNSIYFYHNETLTLTLANFANPAKASGTKTGDQAIKLQGELKFFNNATSTPLYDSGLVGIANLNGMFNPSGPNFAADKTGGVMRVDFTRQIAITPSTGPGLYQNVGVITVSRN